jgi:NAD(P)-dependent dehydrogenase (short-subunit alcohol dehydrogenase family)
MQEERHLYQSGRSTLTNPDVNKQAQASRLRGKVVLVVGGYGENGRALITTLAQKGADVVLVYSNQLPPESWELKEEVESLGQQCLVIAGDPSSKGFAERTMQQIMETFGRLDVFIDYSAQNEAQNEASSKSHPIFPNFAMMAAALGQMSED